MRQPHLVLTALMLALPAWAAAVDPIKPREPGLRTTPQEPGLRAKPKEPGLRAKPRKDLDTPRDPGMAVPPPRVKDDAVKTPPRNIDPKIDDATRKIDEANRAKSNQRPPQQ